jgi:peroxiredoxin Q/BCP
MFMNCFAARVLLVTIFLVFFNCEDEKMNLKIDDLAPDFQLLDDSGKKRSLQEFRGNKVALFFYPKNDTPACTRQACSLRDGYQDLLKENIVILGISYDSPESHRKFKEKYDLPFPLLSDKTREVTRQYGATWPLLGGFIAKRYTYLIDEEGKIKNILKNVDINQHAQEVINAFHYDS